MILKTVGESTGQAREMVEPWLCGGGLCPVGQCRLHALDGGQIRRRQLKLAMAVGTQRHYAIESVVPRHFVQSAEQGGVQGRVVEQLMGELAEAAPTAIASVTAALPRDFPKDIRKSIVGGLERRLGLIRGALLHPGGSTRPKS